MVLPYSHRVSRVRRYSGSCSLTLVFAYGALTLSCLPSHAVQLTYVMHYAVRTPGTLLLLVWPPPRSLATTSGISVDVFSSPYLDVSVQAVPLMHLWIQYMIHGRYPMWIAPFGNLRIKVCLQLPAAYRSLPRPSSAPSAKAFTLRSL